MIRFTKRFAAADLSCELNDASMPSLSLPLDLRIKSRQKVTLSNGEEAGLFLERGILIRGGDVLSSDDGELVKVVAAAEKVSTVRSDDALALCKAAYHLGNRHVPLQIEAGFLRFQHDHVLDAMLEQMGLALQVSVELAAFEPEAGAYQSAAGHSHTHSDGHTHDHTHEHHH